MARGGLPKRLWETLSAFANSAGGGVIILGLDESANFEVVGVENPRKILQDLGSMTAEMEPRLTPVIDVKEVGGRPLVIAEIPELIPGQKPCYFRPAGHSNGAFVRVADGDRRLNSYEVQLMLTSRGQPVDDQEAVSTASAKDLDQSAVNEFLRHVKERRPRFRGASDQRILRSLKVLVPSPDDRNRYVPSVAGLLVFGREPQAFFPQFSVLVTAYPGRDIGEPGPHAERMLDDARIEGSIGKMLSDALIVIARNLRRPRVASGPVRFEGMEIPVAALSEAIVNALVHRDLSPQARGTAVQIQLFVDRVAISNPGGLFGPVSVDSQALSWLSSLGEVARGLSRDQRNALALMRAGEAMNNARYRQIAGADSRVATRELSDLVSRGLAEVVGGGGYTEYVLATPAQPSGAQPAVRPGRSERADRRPEIRRLLGQHGEMSRAALQTELGLGQPIVSRWLKRMIKEGEVQLTTQNEKSPEAKYRLR